MNDTAKDTQHLVIIVSAGRTGTQFYGDLLSSMIPEAHSVHEPDVFEGFNRRTWNKVKTFGPNHMVLKRLLGKSGFRALSLSLLSGKIGLEQAAAEVRRQRFPYYRSLSADLIVESNCQWYGLLPVLPKLFQHYRVAALVRDPRSWVTSRMNYAQRHGYNDLNSPIGLPRLSPAILGDGHYAGRWAQMSHFEKLCWTWNANNELILGWAAEDDRAMVWRYEDLFLSSARDVQVRDLLHFITEFSDRSFPFEQSGEVLAERRNAKPRSSFPDWLQWPSGQAQQLAEICGPLMAGLDYGGEPEWLSKLGEGALSSAQAPRREKMKNRLSLSSG